MSTQDPYQGLRKKANDTLKERGFVGFSKKGTESVRLLGTYTVAGEKDLSDYRREKVLGGQVFYKEPQEPYITWEYHNPDTDTVESGVLHFVEKNKNLQSHLQTARTRRSQKSAEEFSDVEVKVTPREKSVRGDEGHEGR